MVDHGPKLTVHVGFDPDYKPGQGRPPHLPMRDAPALVDTGATESHIDTLVALHLNLPIIDRRKIAGAGGEHETNVYMAQVHIPSLNKTITGQFAGADLVAGGQPIGVIIGRTFLQHFSMLYDGRTGSVLLTDEP